MGPVERLICDILSRGESALGGEDLDKARQLDRILEKVDLMSANALCWDDYLDACRDLREEWWVVKRVRRL